LRQFLEQAAAIQGTIVSNLREQAEVLRQLTLSEITDFKMCEANTMLETVFRVCA
jgi:hypothetical protein